MFTHVRRRGWRPKRVIVFVRFVGFFDFIVCSHNICMIFSNMLILCCLKGMDRYDFIKTSSQGVFSVKIFQINLAEWLTQGYLIAEDIFLELFAEERAMKVLFLRKMIAIDCVIGIFDRVLELLYFYE